MTKARQYQIRAYIAMRNHHEKMLEAAIERNDAKAVEHETKILEALKSILD
jgi:hypothetical protein